MTSEKRYLMALYYAYGRADAARQTGAANIPEPMPFAEHYAAMYDEFMNGTVSSMPSVQDAWDVYRRSELAR